MATKTSKESTNLGAVARRLNELAENYAPPVRSSSLNALEQLIEPIRRLTEKNASAVKVTEQLVEAGMDVSVHTVRRFLRKHDLIKGRKRRKKAP
jgi:hypothetical protein